MKTKLIHLTCFLVALLALSSGAFAQTSAFTYQGRLVENGAPANGSNDLAFTLYTALTGGVAVGAANVVNDVPVTNGLFTVTLDFAGAFDGSPRWLQILARPGGSVGAYTALVPRQPITSTPYAIRALSAGTAASATTANGVAAGSVTGAGLAPGAVNGAAIADASITSADLSGPLLNSTFWKLGGNDVGTTTGANVIGTTNNQAMEVRVFGARALRIEPHGSAAPSLVGGYAQNNAGSSIGGAVAGGGTSGSPNALLGDYAFVGAGHGGRAASFGAVVGGAYNDALGQFAFVGTGLSNTNLGSYAAIVSGSNNFAGVGAYNAFIGGGAGNRVAAPYSTVSGGLSNVAAGYSSFAAGTSAKANHQGTFVWADAQPADFVSTGTNQFLVRAGGGVGINKNNPSTALDVNGIVSATGLNWSSSGELTDDQGGSMELGDSARAFAIPFIDFHYGVSGNQDFNVRLINDANGQLTLVGDFRAQGNITAPRFTGNGTGLTGLNADGLTGTVPTLALGKAWKVDGNTDTAGAFLGTLDSQPMRFLAGNSQVLSLETKVVDLGGRRSLRAANVLGGPNINTIANGVIGATIGGGGSVDVDGLSSTPHPNAVMDLFGTVAGGLNNTAGSADGNISNGRAATVAGGEGNLAGGSHSFIGGGQNNLANFFATIGGGQNNSAAAIFSIVGGGQNNSANGDAATLSGGQNNSIQRNATHSTIAGGNTNVIELSAVGSTISGGVLNKIMAGGVGSPIVATATTGATIGGGWSNTIVAMVNTDFGFSPKYPTISGGYANVASGDSATVSGGQSNSAANHFATVPGGLLNIAGGYASFAAGNQAQALHRGSFVWADSTGGNFTSTADNQFSVRALGGIELNGPVNKLSFGSTTRQMINLYNTEYGIGVQSGNMYFRTDDSAGAQTFAWYRGGKHHDGHFQPGAGGTDMMLLNTAGLEVRGNVCATLFLPCSDRNMKENFSPIDSREVLAKVVSLPISRWNFKEAKSTPHIGPMAQDFYAAFAVGPDNRHIGTVDADGVALAAIQGLNEIVREKDSKIHELEQRMERLEQMMLNSGKH